MPTQCLVNRKSMRCHVFTTLETATNYQQQTRAGPSASAGAINKCILSYGPAAASITSHKSLTTMQFITPPTNIQLHKSEVQSEQK